MRLYTPGHIQTATWTSPFTSRLLLEAGWGNYLSRYANTAPRIDGTHNDALISIIEQCSAGCPTNGGIPNLIYRYNFPLQQGFERHQIGTLAQMRASASYIPGSHNMKFGYQGNVSHPSQGYFNTTPFIQFRFNNGIPNQLTQTAVYPGTVLLQRNILMTSFYAQDTYTRAPPDASGRHPLRRHRHQLPGHRRRRPRLSADADAALLAGGHDRRDPLEGPHAAHRRRLRPVRQRQDGRQGQHRQVPDRADREQQRPGPQPAHPHEPHDDPNVERHHHVPSRRPAERQLRARLRSAGHDGQRRVRGDGQPELRPRDLHEDLRSRI